MSLVLDAATERPAAIYGAALNHRRLQAALAAEFEQAPYQRPPQAPVLFVKPRNTVSASGAPPFPFPPMPTPSTPAARWACASPATPAA
ncbi:hypothetical protein JOS77_23650 [Chromobacterium haemolyticum]|nr:hypothetical protein JOS77_23650 [Chromobacterium haemolyticum]